MAWYTGKPEMSPPIKDIEFYLGEDLVLVCDPFGVTLVEGMYVTYINLAGETVTHRIGGITVVLKEERIGSPPSGLGNLYLKPTVRVELQP